MNTSVIFRFISMIVITTTGLLLATWCLLWLYLLGPLGYTAPEPVDYSAETYHIFAYGTLKQPWIRRFIIGRSVDVHEDSLSGYQRHGLDLQVEPKEVTTGLRFAVTSAEMQRLDRYERLGVRYQREHMQLDSGFEAWVYRRIAVK